MVKDPSPKILYRLHFLRLMGILEESADRYMSSKCNVQTFLDNILGIPGNNILMDALRDKYVI